MREQRLMLARDYIGLRPLYFHRGADFFAFSSMPSGLHALPEVPYDFDRDVIVKDLALLPRVGRATFFRNIERVEPATVLIATRAGVRSSRYWSPPSPARAKDTPQQYAEGLRVVLDQAVAAQLRGAGGAVATHLSAGLDSSIVTTSAAINLPDGKVVAFTATPRTGFDGAVPDNYFGDEGPLAALTAQKFGNIEHILVPQGPESPLENIDRDFFFQQQPIVNLCNAGWGRAINREVNSRDLRVLLIGSLGNMSVSYAGLELLPDLLVRGRLIELIKTSVRLIANGTRLRPILGQILGPFSPPGLWGRYARWRGRDQSLEGMSAVNMAALEALSSRPEVSGHDFAWRPSRRSTELRHFVISRSDGANYFKGVLAEWGISMRDPTADKRVMEYCFSVPTEEYMRGGIARSLGRRAFGSRLASEALTERRQGYQSADWYEVLDRSREQVKTELEAISRCDGAGAVLDLNWLAKSMEDWTEGALGPDVHDRYRLGLLRGIAAGHFMRKVKGTN